MARSLKRKKERKQRKKDLEGRKHTTTRLTGTKLPNTFTSLLGLGEHQNDHTNRKTTTTEYHTCIPS